MRDSPPLKEFEQKKHENDKKCENFLFYLEKKWRKIFRLKCRSVINYDQLLRTN